MKRYVRDVAVLALAAQVIGGLGEKILRTTPPEIAGSRGSNVVSVTNDLDSATLLVDLGRRCQVEKIEHVEKLVASHKIFRAAPPRESLVFIVRWCNNQP